MGTKTRVESPAGVWQGVEARCEGRAVARFRGIPYAAPPLGELRFAPPQPTAPASAPRDVGDYAATPPQQLSPLIELLGMEPLAPAGEDCLSLNVDAPARGEGARPVLFWLHGGAFATGTGAAPAYDAARLVARGDVVVVTCNYRVGALGFLYLEGGGGAPACANLGLLDQIAALAWVRDNIQAFGGDPARVAIFGESAGAGSICALLAAPAARGLFAGAIVQSAAPDGVLTAAEGRERAARFLEVLGVGAGDLRRTPVERILQAQHACASEKIWRTGMFFAPVIDGDVLPRSPLDAAERGECARVPLVIGTTRDELQLYKYGAPPIDLPDTVLPGALAGQLPGAACADVARAESLLKLYAARRRERGESVAGIDLIYAIQTDLAMRVPSTQLAERFAACGLPTWMYRFDEASPIQNGELGACHALDCAYVFGTLEQAAERGLVGDLARARALSEPWMGAWARFAAQGTPADSALGAWPCFDIDARPTLLIGGNGAAGGPGALEYAPGEAERLACTRILEA